MLRVLLAALGCVMVLCLAPQTPPSEAAPAITYSRSVAVPLNGHLLFQKAEDAWAWTFGKEPGARVLASDRDNGILEGTARVNYRSASLGLREETMGVVQYRVVVNVRAGECRITVSELTHTGNKSTPRGGIHMGLLTRGADPVHRIRGVGGGNARRIYAEIKTTVDQRITTLLQAFEARLRASVEP